MYQLHCCYIKLLFSLASSVQFAKDGFLQCSILQYCININELSYSLHSSIKYTSIKNIWTEPLPKTIQNVLKMH